MERMPLIDTDSHISEPADVWTSRLPRKWLEVAPKPVWVDSVGEEQWKVADTLIEGVGRHAVAGWDEYPPGYPKSLAEADAAAYDPKARLERMDEYGVDAQVLYPNIIAFAPQEFQKLGPDVAIACVEAWNDFEVDFASADPKRLLPITMLPFWDVGASVKELERCASTGHRGVLMPAHPERGGHLPLWDDYWHPLLGAAQDADMSINFHVAFGGVTVNEHKAMFDNEPQALTRMSGVNFLNNAKAISDVVSMGVCHRFPRLKFVSVESGVSWLPYLMESLDWHWLNLGAADKHKDRELPSFYIKRQVYGTFWFENAAARLAAELLPDNVMFETDFPHSTSLSPGPKSVARIPRLMAEEAVSGLPEATKRKIFYGTASQVYKVEV